MLQSYEIILKYGRVLRFLFALLVYLCPAVVTGQGVMGRPRVVSTGVRSAREVVVRFDRAMAGDGDALVGCNGSVVGAEWGEREVVLMVDHDLDSAGVEWFNVCGVVCADGSVVGDTAVVAGLPRRAGWMDVVINEVMPYVDSLQSKFVEVWNVSEWCVDLSGLVLCNPDSAGRVKNVRRLCEESVLVGPGRLAVVAQRLEGLRVWRGLSEDAVYLEARMPGFAGKGGEIWLCDTALGMVDGLRYGEWMHSGAVRDRHNVSLERVSARRGTNDAGNWASAATWCGYNTAGWANSQGEVSGVVRESGFFRCDVPQFSPNGDGFHDELAVSYLLPEGGSSDDG